MIACSKEIAETFIKDILPDHYIKAVPGDGFCIIHAFGEGLNSLGQKVTFDNMAQILRSEMHKNIYTNSSTINVSKELDEYFLNPLSKYDKEICDLILEALGMAYKVNIIIFQSDIEKCWIVNNNNDNNKFSETLYFVRTKSLHVDPVLPISISQDTSINNENDEENLLSNNGTIFTTGNVEYPPKQSNEFDYVIIEDTTGESKNVVSIEEDLDNGIASSGEGTNVISIEEDLDNGIASPVSSHLDEFNCINPTAEMIFQSILFEPKRYEVTSPLKRVRENKMYTILMKNHSLEDITADDNGSYLKTSGNTKHFYVNKSDNGLPVVKLVHCDNKGYYYKDRSDTDNRSYANVYVPKENVHSLVRYYRRHKSIKGLKVTIIKSESMQSNVFHPYYCIVYSLKGQNPEEVKDIECSPHAWEFQTTYRVFQTIYTNKSCCII